MTLPSKRYYVFGLPVDAYGMDETVERCVELIDEGAAVQHVVMNVIKTVLCRDDDSLATIVRACPIINPDGTYYTWAARALGAPLPERVAGIDLMARLLASAEDRGWPVYFLGATEVVIGTFVAEVSRRYPRLRIAGARNGFFKGEEADADVAAEVRASGARLLFVGLPSPRKETFIAARLESLGPVFAMGVGGAFDVWAGLARRAPTWMQKAGLEWLFRLMQEPGRMWKRIAVNGWRFTLLFLRELIRRSPAPADA